MYEGLCICFEYLKNFSVFPVHPILLLGRECREKTICLGTESTENKNRGCISSWVKKTSKPPKSQESGVEREGQCTLLSTDTVWKLNVTNNLRVLRGKKQPLQVLRVGLALPCTRAKPLLLWFVPVCVPFLIVREDDLFLHSLGGKGRLLSRGLGLGHSKVSKLVGIRDQSILGHCLFPWANR